MTAITSSKSVIQQEDTAYRRSVSESIMTKFGATNNFIGDFQTDIKEFKLNGSYSVATGIAFFDGVASFFFNSEIVGINFYNGQAGSSGTTEFDIQWKNTAGVTQGSIFSTTPKIASAASDESIGFRNLTTTTDIGGTGITLPVFSKTEFLEGESIFFELASGMISAVNCGITIFYKPIN